MCFYCDSGKDDWCMLKWIIDDQWWVIHARLMTLDCWRLMTQDRTRRWWSWPRPDNHWCLFCCHDSMIVTTVRWLMTERDRPITMMRPVNDGDDMWWLWSLTSWVGPLGKSQQLKPPPSEVPSELRDRLRHVEHVEASVGAFAAILSDQTVVTWGHPGCGGNDWGQLGHLRRQAAFCLKPLEVVQGFLYIFVQGMDELIAVSLVFSYILNRRLSFRPYCVDHGQFETKINRSSLIQKKVDFQGPEMSLSARQLWRRATAAGGCDIGQRVLSELRSSQIWRPSGELGHLWMQSGLVV